MEDQDLNQNRNRSPLEISDDLGATDLSQTEGATQCTTITRLGLHFPCSTWRTLFGRNGYQYTDGLGDMRFIVKITQMGTLIVKEFPSLAATWTSRQGRSSRYSIRFQTGEGKLVLCVLEDVLAQKPAELWCIMQWLREGSDKAKKTSNILLLL